MDPKELREIAKKATPGEWRLVDCEESPGCGNVWVIGPTTHCLIFAQPIADARFIATFNPQKVRELLDKLETAEKDASNWQTHEAAILAGTISCSFGGEEVADEVR